MAPATPRTMQTQNSLPTSALKRKLQVFVEIPPSPLHRSFHNTPQRRISALSNVARKTGIPLTPKPTNLSHTIVVEAESPTKKTKITDVTSVRCPVDGSIKPKTAILPTATSTSTSQEFPNGWFYCHQCNRKRDQSLGFFCTSQPCRNKYCNSCLKNRYGQDAAEIRPTYVQPPPPKSRAGHVQNVAYTWKCPKCCDICNCSRCRKAKGLEPTGKMAKAVISAENPEATGDLSGSIHCKNVKEKTQRVQGNEASGSSEVQPLVKVRQPRIRAKVAEPKWENVPTELGRSQVEDRIFLREFMIRVSPLMDIASKHLEELEDFDFMSDASAKSLVMNLLGLIAADAQQSTQTAIKNTIKQISKTASTPNALWTCMIELRNIVPSSEVNIPLPSPSTTKYRTRTIRTITQSIQLVPLLVGLIETAIRGASVRAEIDNGVKDVKEANKEYFGKVREENERWDEEKTKLNEVKEQNGAIEGWEPAAWTKQYKEIHAKHKSTLNSLAHALELKVQTYAPRFRPLGKDHQGRVYYASSAFLTKKVPSAETRASLKRWSWFLAVWCDGGSGFNQVVKTREDGDSVNEDEVAEHNESGTWWGFHDPKEIKQLAKWLLANSDAGLEDHGGTSKIGGPEHGKNPIQPLHTSGEDAVKGDLERAASNVDGPVTEHGLQALARNLNEFAGLLAWRIEKEK